MSEDKPIPVNLPEGLDEASLDDFRAENAGIFEIRKWLQEAVEAQGARFTGGGCGGGEADIDIELDGARYNIVIKPLRPRERAQ